jgi:hypothetical protein
MDTCDEELTLCSSVSDQDAGDSNATTITTIYNGTCTGLVQYDKIRWCYHQSLNSNICCGNQPSDCCTIATTRLIFSSLGSSVLVVLILVLVLFIHRAARKTWNTMSNRVSTYQPEPKKIPTYKPLTSAAIASMRNQPFNQRSRPVVITTMEQSRVSSIASTLNHRPDTAIRNNVVGNNVTDDNSETKTLAFPGAIVHEESKTEMS